MTLTVAGLFAELTGTSVPDGGSAVELNGAIKRMSRPDFGTWLATVARTGRGCSHPVRISGRVDAVNPKTGEVVESFDTASLPDGVLYKPCGTRRASVCPACAHTYRYDTYHLIASGLRGGKGVPQSVAEHPAVFATLTAPSFGAVHSRVIRKHTCRDRTECRCRVEPCRPRRDHPICEHGRPAHCSQRHGQHDPCMGEPICADCYDYRAQAIWNAFVPVLWARTIDRLTRSIRREAKLLGVPLKLRYAKVAEYQARGVVHLHAICRLDGYDRSDPEGFLPPPASLSTDWLGDLIQDAARQTGILTPEHPDRAAGWPIVWGRQIDIRTVRRGLADGQLTEQHVAGYLAKYATKSTEATGTISARITADTITDQAIDTHVGRQIAACWHLGQPTAGAEFTRLRRWAHMLGFGGHFSTKSRQYSTTLGRLRAARQPRREGVRLITPDEYDVLDQAEDDETTLVINSQWKYHGTGWLTTADAALALSAANAARERRPAR